MKKTINQSGFTLTEITLAMAVFGFLLAMSLGGLLMIFHMYEQGNVSRDVQQNARQGLESMVRDARLASLAGYGSGGLCILGGSGWEVFSVSANKLLMTEETGVDPTTCVGTPIGAAQSLMSDSVQATRITGQIINNNLKITLSVSSDNSLLNSGRTACDPIKIKSQFCSLVTLSSNVDLQGDHQ